MNILFFGSPHYTVSYLDLLEKKHKIAGVVTNTTKNTGRDRHEIIPPPGQWAIDRNIPLFQPADLKDKALYNKLSSLKADLGFVVAYGKIIPESVFSLPSMGCINIHFSLLPKFRGASPIENTILCGDKTSGVSVQKITKKLDAGAILTKKSIEIDPDDHFPEVFKKLQHCGLELSEEALNLLESGKAVFIPQEESVNNLCHKITSGQRYINWNDSGVDVFNKIRAFSQRRTAYTFLNNKRVLIYRAKYLPDISANPGEVAIADKKSLVIACKFGGISVLELQMENKRKMNCHDFINGNRIKSGHNFQSAPEE